MLARLDKGTAQHIADQLFGRLGLIRKQRRTAIVTTDSSKSAPRIYSHGTEGSSASFAAKSDHVIVLSSHGEIISQGKPQDLVSEVEKTLNASHDSKQHDPHAEEEDEDEPAAPISATSKSSSSDQARNTGDWAVYTYYFKIAGGFDSILFLTVCSAFVTGMSLPRELRPVPS